MKETSWENASTSLWWKVLQWPRYLQQAWENSTRNSKVSQMHLKPKKLLRKNLTKHLAIWNQIVKAKRLAI